MMLSAAGALAVSCPDGDLHGAGRRRHELPRDAAPLALDGVVAAKVDPITPQNPYTNLWIRPEQAV